MKAAIEPDRTQREADQDHRAERDDEVDKSVQTSGISRSHGCLRTCEASVGSLLCIASRRRRAIVATKRDQAQSILPHSEACGCRAGAAPSKLELPLRTLVDFLRVKWGRAHAYE